MRDTALYSQTEADMGTFSVWHLVIVVGVAVLLFGGRGRISELMGDLAKGIKSFRQGVTEGDEA